MNSSGAHLFVCPEYPPAAGGGIGTYVENIVDQLVAQGVGCYVVTNTGPGAPAGRQRLLGGLLEVERLPISASGLKLDDISRSVSKWSPHLWFSWQAAPVIERLVKERNVLTIESQEYGAPLYFYQLRRQLQGSTDDLPPVVVHFHSPSALISRFNDRDPGESGITAASRMEDYSVNSADAWLCPSLYLAAQAAHLFRIDLKNIEVIPYPIGSLMKKERHSGLLSNSILYVGRLEERKGVLEWIRAAVSIAREFPDVRFDFVGQNILRQHWRTGREIVRGLIADDVAHQFNFHGAVPRKMLNLFFQKAKLAVIPSRWDNFPNTCMEAMAAGVPVLATRQGGMSELIESGKSGWLVDSADEQEFAGVLKEILKLDDATLADIGTEAHHRVHDFCQNEKIARRHLAFKRSLRSMASSTSTIRPQRLAIVVDSHGRDGSHLVISFRTVRPGQAISVSSNTPSKEDLADDIETALVQRSGDASTDRWKVIDQIVESGFRPNAVVFLHSNIRLDEEYLWQAVSALAADVKFGAIGSWSRSPSRFRRTFIHLNLVPALPYEYLQNDLGVTPVFRWDALRNVPKPHLPCTPRQCDWYLGVGIQEAGWRTLLIPDVLIEYADNEEEDAELNRGYMLPRFAALLPDEKLELLSAISAPSRLEKSFLELSPFEYFEIVKKVTSRIPAFLVWAWKEWRSRS